jgi:hypothetical protein
MNLLHGTQAFGRIHAEQRKHCCEKARGDPGQEELPSTLMPRYQGPEKSDGNKANTPNHTIGVPDLGSQLKSQSGADKRNDAQPYSAARPQSKPAPKAYSRSTLRLACGHEKPTSASRLFLLRPARRTWGKECRCEASTAAVEWRIVHKILLLSE